MRLSVPWLVVLLSLLLALSPARSEQEAFCFSGKATVSVFGKGVVQMRDLQVGDYVITGKKNYSLLPQGNISEL